MAKTRIITVRYEAREGDKVFQTEKKIVADGEVTGMGATGMAVVAALDEAVTEVERAWTEAHKDDPIVRATKAYYNHMGWSWSGSSQANRDKSYDAMHAALKELREPTTAMIVSGVEASARPGVWRPIRDEMWKAMIDKLLEVK